MLQNEELHNVIMMVKFRRIREETHVACMGGARHKKVWSVNQEERNLLECRCDDRIMILDLALKK